MTSPARIASTTGRRAFDAYSGDPGREQLGDHGAKPGLVVGDGEPPGLLAVMVDDGHCMIGAGTVHPGGGSRRLGYIGDTHCCLLAAEAVKRHPVVPGRGCRSHTDRRSMAHSPVASRRVLGHLRLTESARRRPRPGGVSTFRMRELRPGWAPLYAEAYIWSLSSRLHYRLLRFGAISIAKRMRKA